MIRRFFIGLFLQLFLFPPCGLAENTSMLFEQAFDLEKELINLESKSLESSDRTIVQNYQKAKRYLKNGNYADFANTLEETVFISNSNGYTGMPDYSLDLISYSRLETDKEKKKFLFDWALKLSPNDSKVLISIASHYKEIGLENSAKLLFSALKKTFRQPSAFVAFFTSVLMALMLASLVAVFFLMLIKIIRNSVLIRNSVISLFSSNKIESKSLITLLFGSLLTFSLLTVPFYFGLIPGLILWAFLLSRVFKSTYLIVLGVICILWGAVFPLISVVGYNVSKRSNAVFEDLNSSRFSPRAEKYIQKRLENKPDDLLSLFYLAQVFRFNGVSSEAKKILKNIESRTNGETKEVLTANLGVLEFDQGNYNLAKEIFERTEQTFADRGIDSFELYYNLAITHLALANTDEYAEYFQKAKNINKKRLSEIVLEDNAKPKASILPLANTVLFKNLFKTVESDSDKKRINEIKSKSSKLLISRIGGFNSEKTLTILGFILILISMRSSEKALKIEKLKTSKRWLAFPMGRYLASSSCFYGFTILVLFISLILLTKFPIMFGNFKSINSIGNEVLISGLIIFSLIHFLSWTSDE